MTQCIEIYMSDQKKNLKRNRSWIKTTGNEQEISKSLGVFTSIRNMIKERWYFDNGYSQHMMGNECFLLKEELW